MIEGGQVFIKSLTAPASPDAVAAAAMVGDACARTMSRQMTRRMWTPTPRFRRSATPLTRGAELS